VNLLFYHQKAMPDLTKVQQVVQDIYDIKIQGATNIAKSAFQVLIDELERQKFSDGITLREFLFPAMDILEKARPTEPMMFNGMAYIKAKVENEENGLLRPTLSSSSQ
jgi:methylthioribose-1-phosphate isomerase